MFIIMNDYVYSKRVDRKGSITMCAKCNIYKIDLTSDKSQVIADGTESCQITATVKKVDIENSIDHVVYSDTSDYGDKNIEFKVAGTAIELPVINGVATLEFDPQVVGEYEISIGNVRVDSTPVKVVAV